MSVAGIDLGDATSTVALARKRGVDVLMNKESKRENATAVSFGEKSRSFCGDAAANRGMAMASTAANVRGLLGMRWASAAREALTADLPYAASDRWMKKGGDCLGCWARAAGDEGEREGKKPEAAAAGPSLFSSRGSLDAEMGHADRYSRLCAAQASSDGGGQGDR